MDTNECGTRSDLFLDVSEQLNEFARTRMINKNKYISDDLDQLQEHYSIVLEYVKELERKLNAKREQNYKLQLSIKRLETRLMYDEPPVEDTRDISLKSTIAGLKSVNARYKKINAKLKKDVENLSKDVEDLSKEVKELREFRSTMITVLNGGDGKNERN